MTDDVRRRAACDRCQSHKVKCPRRPGEDTCDRCIRSRTSCVFSPFRQKKASRKQIDAGISNQDHRSNGQSITVSEDARHKRSRIDPSPEALNFHFDPTIMFPSTSLDHRLNADLDINWMTDSFPPDQDYIPNVTQECQSPSNQTAFPFLSFDETISKTNNLLQTRGQDDLNGSCMSYSHVLRSNGVSKTLETQASTGLAHGSSLGSHVEQSSLGDCVHKLSQLSLNLFEHSTTIPPLSIHDLTSEDNGSARTWQGYDPGETFRLTQTLIEIYTNFMSTAISPPPSQSSSPNFSWLDTANQNTPSDLATDTVTPESGSFPNPSTPTIDHASVLLILSCHLRLISIYDCMFQHMEICIIQGMGKGAVAGAPQEMAFAAPQLKIGTYVPPKSAAVPMQMLMLIQFTTQLYDHVAELTSKMKGPEDDSPLEEFTPEASGDDALALSRKAAESVKSKARKMSQQLSDLRTRMLESGLMA